MFILLSFDILKATLYYANPINNTVKFSIISNKFIIYIGLILFYSLGFSVAVNAPFHDNVALIIIPFITISIAVIFVSCICFHIKQKKTIGHLPLISKHFNIKLINPIIISLAIVWWGYFSNPLFTNLYHSVVTSFLKKSQKHSIYRIDISKNCVTVLIPQFTVGISGFNQIDWGELNIIEVIDELYQSIISVKANVDVDCKIYVNLYYYNTDKYGNKTINGRIYELLTVSHAEVRRYKNSRYFEQDYDIINQITRLPFDKKAIKEWTQILN